MSIMICFPEMVAEGVEPHYELDDGQLTDEQYKLIQEEAKQSIGKRRSVEGNTK